MQMGTAVKEHPFLLCTLSLLLLLPRITGAQTDRARDGLVGPVRTVVTEKIGVVSPPTPERDSSLQDDVKLVRWQPERSIPAHPESDPDWQQKPRILWRTIAYDAQGKRTEAAFYTDTGTLRWKWRYTYDTQGNRIGRASYDTTGTLRWTWRYRYDTQGNITEHTEYNADGTLTRRWQYVYDTTGKLLEKANYHTSGSRLWKWRYTYDASGRRTAKTQYTAHDIVVRQWQYTYDASGHLLEETHYSAIGTPMWQYRYAYDASGNVTEEHRYKADGSLLGKWRHIYAYDTRGNWIRRTTARWVTTAHVPFFEPSEMTYRTLTYYGGR
jgi:YD repeat-containing protein